MPVKDSLMDVALAKLMHSQWQLQKALQELVISQKKVLTCNQIRLQELWNDWLEDDLDNARKAMAQVKLHSAQFDRSKRHYGSIRRNDAVISLRSHNS